MVPERAAARQVWRAIGSPGVLLVDGDVAGTWRPRMRGTRLEVTVEPFGAFPAGLVKALLAEAEAVASTRKAADVQVRLPGE